MEFKNLKDTSYESYVFDTGYVVSECEKGVYKIDGVTLVDKNFDTKDVTIDSFIRVADMNTDSKIYVGTLKNTWHLGYTYYITKALTVDKVLNGVSFKNIKGYFKSSDLIVVGVRQTSVGEEFVIVCCVNGFRCGSSYHRPKIPAIVLKDADEFIGVYLDKGKIVFRPYIVGLNNCRLYPVYATAIGSRCRNSRNNSLCFANVGGRIHYYVESNNIVEVDGLFLKIGDCCTLDKSKDIGDTLIFPNDCKYIFGEAIDGNNVDIQNVVFSKSIDKYIAKYRDEALLSYCRNLKCLYFSQSTPLKTVIKLCRDCLISKDSKYYSKMTKVLKGIDSNRFNSIEEFISEAEKWLRYPFKGISIDFY
jgi:hypothetical protein